MARKKDLQEQISYQPGVPKSKANPNRNNHTKRKNSNYGGYTSGQYMDDRFTIDPVTGKKKRGPVPENVKKEIAKDAVIVVLMLLLMLVIRLFVR